jgi:hypothetical protein
MCHSQTSEKGSPGFFNMGRTMALYLFYFTFYKEREKKSHISNEDAVCIQPSFLASKQNIS